LPLRKILKDDKTLEELARRIQNPERVCSVCSGAFILAKIGLLDGKLVTTHWMAAPQLARFCPKAKIDSNLIYNRDGKIWTSAGVTTGIDMALAIIEKDWGPQIKLSVAKRLVLSTHRPGYQSQFSEIIKLDQELHPELGRALNWFEAQKSYSFTASQWAEAVGIPYRTFFRLVVRMLRTTPSKLLRERQMLIARKHLESGRSIKETMATLGFSSEAAFRLSFKNEIGISPSFFRKSVS
jgi:transcriptional regulator GlxA family with amidase domain